MSGALSVNSAPDPGGDPTPARTIRAVRSGCHNAAVASFPIAKARTGRWFPVASAIRAAGKREACLPAARVGRSRGWLAGCRNPLPSAGSGACSQDPGPVPKTRHRPHWSVRHKPGRGATTQRAPCIRKPEIRLRRDRDPCRCPGPTWPRPPTGINPRTVR